MDSENKKIDNDIVNSLGAVILLGLLIWGAFAFFGGNFSNSVSTATNATSSVPTTLYTKTTANVRACASLDCKVIGTYSPNTAIYTTTASPLPDWVQLNYTGDQTGYISKSVLSGTLTVAAPTPIQSIVKNTEIKGQSYYLKNGAFSMWFPEEPVLSTQQQDFGNGISALDYVYDFTKPDKSIELQATYVKGVFANLNTTPEENLKNELSYTEAQGGSQVGWSIISSNLTTYNGLPAIDYLNYIQSAGIYILGKDIARGNDLYMLQYWYPSGKENKQLENSFFPSLTFSALTQNQSQTVKKSLPEVINEWRHNVALVVCGFYSTDVYGNPSKSIAWGSGFLRAEADQSIRVYTNKHVVTDTTGAAAYYGCEIKLPDDSTTYPINANQMFVSPSGDDWAYLVITAATDLTQQTAFRAPSICPTLAQSGDNVLILGYPDYSGNFSEPTATQGIISGLAGTYYNTSAKIESGNSGGVALDPDRDCYLGIPSAVRQGNFESLGKILRADFIFKFQ